MSGSLKAENIYSRLMTFDYLVSGELGVGSD